MTIPTTTVFTVDLDRITTRRQADVETSRAMRAPCSEIERRYWLTEIEEKRRRLHPLRYFMRVPSKGNA